MILRHLIHTASPKQVICALFLPPHRDTVSRRNLGPGNAIFQSRTNDRQALSGLCPLGL